MKLLEKEKSIKLREKGFSLKEISNQLSVSKSSISLWVRDVVLTKEATTRLESRYTVGQLRSQRTLRDRRLLETRCIYKKSENFIKKIKFSGDQLMIMLSLIYWCEGGKQDTDILAFANSDPDLVKMYMLLLRLDPEINERKFRVCIHLHEYHDEYRVLRFWSKISGIPISQFTKPYRKENTSKVVRKGYMGCASIRYSDIKYARKIRSLGKLFLKNYRVLS